MEAVCCFYKFTQHQNPEHQHWQTLLWFWAKITWMWRRRASHTEFNLWCSLCLLMLIHHFHMFSLILLCRYWIMSTYVCMMYSLVSDFMMYLKIEPVLEPVTLVNMLHFWIIMCCFYYKAYHLVVLCSSLHVLTFYGPSSKTAFIPMEGIVVDGWLNIEVTGCCSWMISIIGL
jgi:hypothetical protein